MNEAKRLERKRGQPSRPSKYYRGERHRIKFIKVQGGVVGGNHKVGGMSEKGKVRKSGNGRAFAARFKISNLTALRYPEAVTDHRLLRQARQACRD